MDDRLLYQPNETVLEIIDFLAERWVLLAIYNLMKGPRGFNELGRDCGGASGKVLIQKLEKMERLGIVQRTVLSVVPPRTRYALTPAGQALGPTIDALNAWGKAYLATPVDWSDNSPIDEGANIPLRLLQEKWVMRLVHALLSLGSSGYNELGRILGINVATLGQRLRSMEAAGLVNKAVVREKPLLYAYTLTESGRALQPVLGTMEQWTYNQRTDL